MLAFLAYGPILWNGSGFSHPDDSAAAQLTCCSFRPLLALTYQFNTRFGGWMAVNLVLHLLAAWLLLYLTGPIAAAIFAVHPMAADAVASVSGRSGLLLAVSVLVGIAVYRWSRTAGFLLGACVTATVAGFVPRLIRTIQGAPGYREYPAQLLSALSDLFAKMLIPIGLTGEPLPSASPWMAFAGLVLFLAFGVLAVKFPKLRLGIGLLALPLIPYFFIPLPNGFYEHRAYLSLAGASILMAEILRRMPRAALVVVPAFLLMAEARTRVYSSPVALWEDAVSKDPTNGRALVNLGSYYAMAGRWYEAEAEFQEAVQVAPEIEMGWRNLTALYVMRGRIADASRTLDAQDEYRVRFK